MKTLLIHMIEGMKKTAHLRELLGKHDVIVEIIYGDEHWYMQLVGKDSKLSLTADKSDIVIQGEEEELKLLFRGEDFLLAMKRREDLYVEGSLKHLLWLESLFYLSKKTKKVN